MQVHPRIAERATEPRYSIREAASFIDRPHSTVRRWAIGNVRKHRGVARQNDPPIRDQPLILVDGGQHGVLPLSFLNLLELRFLASYRSKAPLQAIRRALEFAASELHETRPLLSSKFKVQGKSLFLRYAEEGGASVLMNASEGGQLAWPPEAGSVARALRYGDSVRNAHDWWPPALDDFMDSVDYDDRERSAHRWWPLGRHEPVIVDTLLNGGIPSTALSGVRTNAIAGHRGEGFDVREIAADVGASEDEVNAALRFERIAS